MLGLEAVDRELDCCYFNDMQQHMDEDADESKEDTVAVADRLAKWQSTRGRRLHRKARRHGRGAALQGLARLNCLAPLPQTKCYQ